MAHSCVTDWHTLPVDSSEAACYLAVRLAKVTGWGVLLVGL